MQLWSAVSWSWRALRGQSVTFAALFACGVLGLSLVGQFRHLLSRWHAPWYAWLIIPMILIGYVAKKESQWIPDPDTRRKWSRRLLVGSIGLAILIAKFGPSHRAEPTGSPAESPGAVAPPK